MRSTLDTLVHRGSQRQALLPVNQRLLNEIVDRGQSLWFPEWALEVPKMLNILGILQRPDGILAIPAHNIVTTAGDVHYAQRATGQAVTNDFTSHAMASAGPATPAKGDTYGLYTVIAGSLKVNDTGYPQANNQDADNTTRGAGTITHKVSYTRGDFNAASITHGLITIAAPVAGSALLCGYAWPAAFAKTVDDTLTVYVNHQILGV